MMRPLDKSRTHCSLTKGDLTSPAERRVYRTIRIVSVLWNLHSLHEIVVEARKRNGDC